MSKPKIYILPAVIFLYAASCTEIIPTSSTLWPEFFSKFEKDAKSNLVSTKEIHVIHKTGERQIIGYLLHYKIRLPNDLKEKDVYYIHNRKERMLGYITEEGKLFRFDDLNQSKYLGSWHKELAIKIFFDYPPTVVIRLETP